MKKLVLLIIIISISFISFLLFTFMPKNYEYTYIINNISVTESFSKAKNIYYIKISSNDNIFEYSVSHKYSRKRGIIKSVKIKDECVQTTSKNIESFSICKEANDYVTSYFHYEDSTNVINSVDNIDIYNLMAKKFLIWNYTYFIAINEDTTKKIDLFNRDIYELELITKIKNYLIVADYNEKYNFEKLYLINSKNNNVKEMKLDRKINFNSYILGTYKNYIYLYDLEKELEYKINPFKASITKNSYEILADNKWQKVSVNKLNKKNIHFSKSSSFEFELKDEVLYYKTANIYIKIVDMPVTNLLQQDNNEAYFISGDSLYYVNFVDGIKKIMSYSEWQFNNHNIYVF